MYCNQKFLKSITCHLRVWPLCGVWLFVFYIELVHRPKKWRIQKWQSTTNMIDHSIHIILYRATWNKTETLFDIKIYYNLYSNSYCIKYTLFSFIEYLVITKRLISQDTKLNHHLLNKPVHYCELICELSFYHRTHIKF